MKRKSTLLILLTLITMLALPLTANAAKVKLNKKKTTVYVGDTVRLKVKGTKKKVKWSSSNKNVAAVSKKGKVTGRKEGKATITAKVGKKKYKCKVTVRKKFNLADYSQTVTLSTANIDQYLTCKVLEGDDTGTAFSIKFYWNNRNVYCYDYNDLYIEGKITYDYVNDKGKVCHGKAKFNRKGSHSHWDTITEKAYNQKIEYTSVRGTLQLVQKAAVARIEKGSDSNGKHEYDSLYFLDDSWKSSMFSLL